MIPREILSLVFRGPDIPLDPQYPLYHIQNIKINLAQNIGVTYNTPEEEPKSSDSILIKGRGGESKVITKGEMLKKLVEATELKKKDIVCVLDAQNEILAKSLKKDKKFKLQGLGIFTVRNRKARMARNPRTGEMVKVAAKTVIRFRVSKDLKTKVLGQK
jgi:DNA-binding protein HU-beta